MLKCPVLVRQRELSLRPYFELDVNIWPDRTDASASSDMVEPTLSEFIEKLQKVELVNVLKETHTDPVFRARLADCIKLVDDRRAFSTSEKSYIPVKRRHYAQFAAIVTAMKQYGLVHATPTNSPVYVEFGAGRGYLSHFLSDTCENLDIILLERRAYRFKAERSMRERAGSILRLQVDIKDVVLHGLERLNSREFIGFGKHLCGAATDYALRACFSPPSANFGKERLAKGFAVATCCHHLCSWDSYINRPFLVQMGFDLNEFHLLTKISSWATLSDAHGGVYRNQTGHSNCELALRPVEKLMLGRRAKLILDEGRVRWLLSLGLKAKLLTYVDASVSPENILLLVHET